MQAFGLPFHVECNKLVSVIENGLTCENRCSYLNVWLFHGNLSARLVRLSNHFIAPSAH
jgi:hypothetical protein